MKHLVFLLATVLFFSSTVYAQHHKPHHGDLKAELNLSPEQMEKIKAMDESLRKEMRDLKENRDENTSREEMKVKWEAIVAKKKTMMAEILTDEQETKLAQMEEERMQKKKEHKAHRKEMQKAKKPMMDEIKAYYDTQIKPAIVSQRSALDKDLKRKDRKKVNKLRAIAKTEMDKLEAEYEARKANAEMKGENKMPHHHGKKGHRGMHKGAKGMMGAKELKMMMNLMNDYQEEIKEAMEIAEKYNEEITSHITTLEKNNDKWASDLRDIREKYISKENRQRKKEFKSKKDGSCKGSSRTDDSPGCKKATKSCDAEKGQSRKGGKFGMMEEMKNVAFLLMPSEMIEEEIQKVVQPLMVLESKVFPNPSGNQNTLEFNVVQSGRYLVELYNKDGKRIKVITNKTLEKGIQSFDVDLSNLPSGSYYYIITDGKSKTSEQFIKN